MAFDAYTSYAAGAADLRLDTRMPRTPTKGCSDRCMASVTSLEGRATIVRLQAAPVYASSKSKPTATMRPLTQKGCVKG